MTDKLGKKVLVALSGGVDSAVAAALLLKAGYEATGAFIKCFIANSTNAPATLSRGAANNTNNCWIDERRDAMRVAAKLGIKLLTFDFEKEYHRFVVDYLFREYQAGRTPNPDVVCNQRVKIPLLLREAKKLGFDYVATGHYARLGREIRNPILKLLEAVDKSKDQTYFLHQLKQEHLKKLIFPLGGLHKTETRRLAKQWRLPVADKEESMGICFIGERKMGEFLGQRLKDKPGDIVAVDGQKIARHRGLFLYTIGQRQGLMIGGGIPYFVVDKNLKRNRLIVAPGKNHPALFKKSCLVRQAHWIAGQPPKFPLKCEVRLRHRQLLQKCLVTQIQANKMRIKANRRFGYGVVFDEPQRAVTPGQFAVFYKEGECLGGGETA